MRFEILSSQVRNHLAFGQTLGTCTGLPPSNYPDGFPMVQTELWLTPLILLPGVALLIMSTSARFWQIHEEFHRLLERPDDHSKIISRQLLRRGRLLRNALVCLYTSVGLFSIGSLLGGFINLWAPSLLWLIGGITLIGIAALVSASAQLIRESLVCMNVIADDSRKVEGLISHERSS